MAKEQFSVANRNDGRLYCAVVRGDLKTVAKELNAGDVDLSLMIDGKSFLRHAGERGFQQIADLLIRNGLDPNETYGQQQRSLLHFAAATFNYGFASLLLENRADPNLRTTSGATPLHFAARSGQSYLAAKLIEAGANSNVEDHQGRTPLMLARDKGYFDTIKILSDAGGRHLMDRTTDSPRSSVADSAYRL